MRLAAAVLGTPDPRALARFHQRRLGGYTEPHEDVRVYADPDGHPFCLFVRTPAPG